MSYFRKITGAISRKTNIFRALLRCIGRITGLSKLEIDGIEFLGRTEFLDCAKMLCAEMKTKTLEEKGEVWPRIQQGYIVWDSRKSGLVNHTSHLIGVPQMWTAKGHYGMLAYLAYAAFLADEEVKTHGPAEKQQMATDRAVNWLRQLGVPDDEWMV